MNETIPSQLNHLDTERIKGYKTLLDFYYGIQWVGRERWGERRLTFNYAKVFIEKITSYLMSGISYAVESVKDTNASKEKAGKAIAALYRVHEENYLEQLDLETEIDCAVLGDGCYKVIWDADEKKVRVTAPDVQGIYAWWYGDDISRVWRIASRYSLGAEELENIYGIKPENETATVIEMWTDSNFELYLDKPDSYRCFFVEKFTGTEAYNRPFWSHSVPDSAFIDSLWREPVPFNLSSEYGLAIAHHGDNAWLSNNDGVWMAGLAAESLDLTADVTGLKCDNAPERGRLTVELRNDDGRYAAPGEGDLKILEIGCGIEVSPGYVTGSGNESSPGLSYRLDAREHTSSGGKAAFVLQGRDSWASLEDWKARHQFRWNKASDDMSVKDIVAFILARGGLKLEVVSQSSTITSFYPDITLSARDDGRSVIQKLLSFVPDVIFIEGNTAYLVNPQLADTSVYSYGDEHVLFEGRYRKNAQAINRVQVEGYDSGSSEPIIADSFSWGEVEIMFDRLKQVEDRNIGTVGEAQQRGQAMLRQSEIDAADGSILVPVNCGQQLYDVIDITDGRAGLDAEKKRVLGISLEYSPLKGEYTQRLRLGAV